MYLSVIWLIKRLSQSTGPRFQSHAVLVGPTRKLSYPGLFTRSIVLNADPKEDPEERLQVMHEVVLFAVDLPS